MNKLLVSIIMPYYKKDKYIRDTINSILNQTFQNFEILIVDDELTEESNKVLKELKKVDGRIKVIENQKNLGAGLSRNKAIDFSKGSYLAFCDCDDLWERTKLNTQLNFMNELKIDFSYTSYEIINKDGKTIDYRNADQEITFNKLLRSCDIGLS